MISPLLRILIKTNYTLKNDFIESFEREANRHDFFIENIKIHIRKHTHFQFVVTFITALLYSALPVGKSIVPVCSVN